jgi:thiol-disulfide isomerase/thioredoxin
MTARTLLALVLPLACACAPEPRAIAQRAPIASSAAAAVVDRPLVVVVRAEWCAACHRAAPAVAWLREEYGDRVRFLELDVTDDEAVSHSKKKASGLGLAAFFEESCGQPGVIVLGKDGRTVHRFAAEYRGAPYQRAVEEALASFTRPVQPPP